MGTLLRDLKYGLRMLARNPGFTAVAVITLALGIGATTAMFSVFYCGFVNPYPYRDSHRLATLVEYHTKWGAWANGGELSAPELLYLREQNRVFDGVIGAQWKPVVLTGADAPERIDNSRAVTDNFFGVLGVPPLVGRAFGPDDSKPGASPVVVLGYKLWQSRFGGDPSIMGRTLVLDHQPTTVIGVMPPRFSPFGANLWLPANLSPSNAPVAPERFRVWGHLKPGVPIEQANADVAVLGKRLAAIYPKDILPDMYYGAELFDDFYGSSKTLHIFLGAVGLLLLIACVNVANLLLARASAREKEFAIRASLGAGRRRLVRQLLLESLLLALGGAVLGCLLAWNVLGGLAAFLHDRLPSEAAIQINGPVLLFCLGAALLSTLLFGLVPALQAVRKDLEEPLKASSKGAGQSRRHSKIQNLAVVSEVVLSLVLLTGASLLIRTFLALHRIEFGFNPQNVLVASVELPDDRYKTPEQRVLFETELLRRVRALPGVVSAAFGEPPSRYGDSVKIEIAGKPAVDKWGARIRWAGDGYFETLGVPVLQGRGFSQQDIAHARNVAVVNRAFADTYFGRENPLGRQVKLRDMEMARPYLGQHPGFETVGVVGDTVTSCYEYVQCKLETIYVPYSAGMPNPIDHLLHVRTVGEPTLLLNSVRHEVMAIDKELPVSVPYFGWTLQDMVTAFWYAEPRSDLTLLAAFASLGLALVCVGLYSVLSYSVSRRTHEIGVRMALGAEATDVRRMVMMSGLRWLAVGIGIGVAASIALAKILQNRIWWIKGADPLTLAAAALVLTAVGLAACYFPARRATKVDPMVALRYE